MSEQMTAVYGSESFPVEHEPGMPDWLLRLGYNFVPESPYPTRNHACDLVSCFTEDYEDIVNGTSTELRAIYLDTRYEIRICANCIAAGKHIDD